MHQLNSLAADLREQRLRLPFGRRALALAAALALELLLILLLLSLGRSAAGPEAVQVTEVSLSAQSASEEQEPTPPEPEPDEPAATQEVRDAPAPTAPPQVAPAEVAPAPPPPAAILPVSPRQMAEADIATIRPRATAPVARPPGPPMGPPAPSTSGDTPRVGTAPNGEPLFAAAWYREPYDEELRGYLSTASGPGWGLIACKTVPDFRVEDCVELDENPTGSNIGRSVLAAAWQFRVRPPRKGGVLQVGAWVRIRITYDMKVQ